MDEILVWQKKNKEVMDRLNLDVPEMKQYDSPTSDIELSPRAEFQEHIDERLDHIEKRTVLTNEQRAHDLALITVKLQLENRGTMDTLGIYMSAYEQNLAFFKKQFPDG